MAFDIDPLTGFPIQAPLMAKLGRRSVQPVYNSSAPAYNSAAQPYSLPQNTYTQPPPQPAGVIYPNPVPDYGDPLSAATFDAPPVPQTVSFDPITGMPDPTSAMVPAPAMTPPPEPAPIEPAMVEPEEDPGMLMTILDQLGRPQQVLFNLLQGRGGAALRSAVWKRDAGDFTNFQSVLKSAGVLDRDNYDLLSPEGALGAAGDFILDPLNLLAGAGAMTKAGKGARLVAGHLKDVERIGLEATELAARSGTARKAAMEADNLGNLTLSAERNAMADALETEAALKRKELQAAREALAGPAVAPHVSGLQKSGLYDQLAQNPALLDEMSWGDQAQKGLRSALSVGGDVNPIPGLPSIDLPEFNLIQGAGALNALQETGKWLKAAPPVKALSSLFAKTGDLLPAEEARIVREETERSKNIQKGLESNAQELSGQYEEKLRKEAARTAGKEFDQSVEDLARVPEKERAAAASPMPGVDPNTGELLPGAMDVHPDLARQEADLLHGFALQQNDDLGRIAKAGDRKALAQETGAWSELIDVPALKAGDSVTFSPKDELTGAAGRKRNDINGRIIAKNSDGTFTIKNSKGQYIVPGDKVQDARGLENAQKIQSIEYKTLPPEVRGPVGAMSADTREAMRHVMGIETKSEQEFYILNKKARDQYMTRDLGLPDTGPTEQARMLPKAVEQLAQQAGAMGSMPAHGLKTVEFKALEELGLATGDKIPIGKDIFTLKEIDPLTGMVKLKDHWEIEVPQQFIPIDKAAKATKVGEAAPVSKRPLSAVEYGKQAAEKTRAATAQAVRQAKEAAIPLDLQQELDALRAPKSTAQMSSIPEVAIEKELGTPSKVGPKVERELGQLQKMREQHIKDIEARLQTVPSGSPEYHSLLNSLKEAQRDLNQIEAWRTTGQKPPGFGRKMEFKEAEGIRQRSEYSKEFQKTLQMQQYLHDAGYSGARAADDAQKLLPRDASESVFKAVTNAIETGRKSGGPAHVVRAAEAASDQYKTWQAAEKLMTTATPDLKDPVLEYTTRVATKDGAKYFKGLKPESRADLYVALEQARAKKGVAGQVNDLVKGGKPRPGVEGITARYELPPMARKEWEQLSKKMAPATREFIEKNDLQVEFMSFQNEINTSHASQIPRLQAFKGLTIPELNEVFKAKGAKGAVFNENPAAQLAARGMRHAAVKAADEFFKGLARRLGRELPAGVNDLAHDVPEAANIEMYRHSIGAPPEGFGIKSINEQRKREGLRPIVFKSIDEAKAANKIMSKMLNPEETTALAQFWDDTTRMMKAWVTKGFPAYHMRNHMSNRLQSFLEDVPVTGPHYSAANKIMAGQEVELLLNGRKLNRDEVLKLATDHGVVNGGYFEHEFGKKLGKSERNETTWNPLVANNKYVAAGERLGAGLAAAPGQILSGAGVKTALNADASIVENTDRLGHFIYKMKQGETPARAAQSVTKALFDYGDLNDFEKNVASRVVYFYGYTRKALPYVLEKMIEKPAAVAAMGKLAQSTRNSGPENVPTYAKEGLPITLGRDEQNNPLMVYGLGTPLEGAFDPFTGFADGYSRGAKKLLSTLNPLARIPLETAMGENFFLDRKIEEARKVPHWVEVLPPEVRAQLGTIEYKDKRGNLRIEMDPNTLYALENSPLGRLSNTAGKAVDERKGLGARALNLLTGAKVVSVDEDREAYLAGKRQLERDYAELERKGLVNRFENTSVNKQAAAQVTDPETQALIAAIQAREKSLKSTKPKAAA